ncbi:DUF6193 family natural product biosynthesis protein [Kitasatospora sp. NPDC098652]|uniref:DUF6193 family natural product biosynthesis protein n=1 Tax=Kitasatospora sp. NPDC098652 TaxID=3364095 RepID=UPI00382BEA0A
MSESRDIPTARPLLPEGTGARRGDALVAGAAYARPRLRGLHPRPSHGSAYLLHEAPARSGAGDIASIVCSGPPYRVHAPGHQRLPAESATPEEAVAVLPAHLPPTAPRPPP